MLICDTLALRAGVFVNRSRYRSAVPFHPYTHADSRVRERTVKISFKYAYRIRIALSRNVRRKNRTPAAAEKPIARLLTQAALDKG